MCQFVGSFFIQDNTEPNVFVPMAIVHDPACQAIGDEWRQKWVKADLSHPIPALLPPELGLVLFFYAYIYIVREG